MILLIKQDFIQLGIMLVISTIREEFGLNNEEKQRILFSLEEESGITVM